MLISKYGFTDVLEKQMLVLDPSRVAVQIVPGIGFLGAGLIFVHRGSVGGLTTAASNLHLSKGDSVPPFKYPALLRR